MIIRKTTAVFLFCAGLFCLAQAQVPLTGAGKGAPGGVVATTTWNPSDKAVNITLSGSNLIATDAGSFGPNISVRTVASHASGKWCAKFTPTLSGVPAFLGIGDSGFPIDPGAVGDANFSVGYSNAGSVRRNGTLITTFSPWITADTIIEAIDFTTKLFWVRVDAGNWNNDPAADPVTGANGFDISALGAGPFFAAVTFTNTNDTQTADFSGASCPTGYTGGY